MKILLIGVGNDFRSDDAVGLLVARRFLTFSPDLPQLTVLEAIGEGTTLMELWREVETVILVDAVSSGSTPGTIHRLEAHTTPIPAEFFRYSTHSFGVAEAIEMARVLECLPLRLIVYGIEGKVFAAGVGLSPEVQEAAKAVLDLLRDEIQAMARLS